MIGCGRGSFELTGLKDEATLGRPVKEVLGLRFARRARTRSRPRWSGACGCWASQVRVEAEGDLPAEATADVFPAYDDDGGLLLVLTPEALVDLNDRSSQRTPRLESPRGTGDRDR